MMIKVKKNYIIFVLVFILSMTFGGCASGKGFSHFEQAKNDKALVYFYRPDQSIIRALDPVSILKDKENSDGYEVNSFGNVLVGTLWINSHIKREFNAGEHSFWTGNFDKPMKVNLKAGSVSCIMADATFFVNLHSIILQDLNECKLGIRTTKESED